MEYVNLVSKIVAAEHSATEIVQEAKTREEHLEADLAQELATMRESYLARANHRLELVRETEETAAAESIAALDGKLADSMAAVEASYAKDKEHWVDTLFTMIVGERK